MKKQTKNDITEYNDRELSQYFLSVEPLHIRMMTETEDTLRKVAEDSFIFTEAQWNDLLATRKEWLCEPNTTASELAIKDCPHGEPFHYHHDGCPSCEAEEEATKIVSLQGREQYEYIMKRFDLTEEQALLVLTDHNQDVSFLEEESKYIAEPCPKCKGYGWITDTSLQGYKWCQHCNKTGLKRREK